MSAVFIFVANFVLVMTLGLQNINVVGGHRLLAVLTSFAISGANLVILKMMLRPTGAWEVVAYLLSGALGILASMVCHPWMAKKFGNRE